MARTRMGGGLVLSTLPQSKIRLERYNEIIQNRRNIWKEWGIGEFTFTWQSGHGNISVFQKGQHYDEIPVQRSHHDALRRTIKKYVFEKLLAGRKNLL